MEKVSGKADKITFYVPLPDSLNVTLRSHWSKRYKAQQEINEVTGWEIRRHFKSAIPDWGKVKAKFLIYSNKMMDADNRIMTIKTLADAFVKSGLIRDDTDEYISYELPNMVIDPRASSDSRRVKVEIWKEEKENGKLSQP